MKLYLAKTLDNTPYLAEYDFTPHKTFEGHVYRMIEAYEVGSDTPEYEYFQRPLADSSPEKDDKVIPLFKFSLCWRGIWEGRICFTDDEYWSEELSEMNEVWTQLQESLKSELRTMFPNDKME